MNEKAPKRWAAGEMLAALPPPGEPMTLADLAEKIGLPTARVTRMATRLIRHGLITAPRRGAYRRTEAGDVAIAAGRTRSGPKKAHGKITRTGGFCELIWRALRIRKRATIPELLEIIDHETTDPEGRAARYLAQLRWAGVTATPKRRAKGDALQSNGHMQHVLLRDLGPKAPIWRQPLKKLWDANSESFVDEIEP